jgi:hypothetical protein
MATRLTSRPVRRSNPAMLIDDEAGNRCELAAGTPLKFFAEVIPR